MRKCVVILLALSVLWLLVFGFLNSGAIRSAGWAHSISDLEGMWVLDHVRGSLESAPPEYIYFAQGPLPETIQVSDGTRQANFSIHAFQWVFAADADFSPLLPHGSTTVNTGTHFCPPVPQWDHLKFYPTGPALTREDAYRVVTYERE